MKLIKLLFLSGFMTILLVYGCRENSVVNEEFNPILPVPKEINLQEGILSFQDTLVLYADLELLEPLHDVLKQEFKSLYLTEIIHDTDSSGADILLYIDPSMDEETYRVAINNTVVVTGGSYCAVAMGTVTVLQSISETQNQKHIRKGIIYDFPDLPFRGLMIDVARRKHSITVLKQIVSLCRWYKIHYLQLHLTDENYFSFPTEAYPQLATEEFRFEKDELIDLIDFANANGVEIIPELEVPGHAGQFIEKMPHVFGFSNHELNRQTINIANEEIYPILDTLIGEIADIFHSSSYIHIGGDEPNFRGMDEYPQMQQYLKSKGLESEEHLYWHFINRMHGFVKKRGRQTIVWEGFSKEGIPVVSKDIIVMAWETMYQLPSELLDGGYTIINVSWKPLYVVNTRKWNPSEILAWNVYQWQNWIPQIASYDTIQIDEHQNVIGASMASWDQPEYTEISSLRRRLPAMAERVWNVERNISDAEFQTALDQLDEKLSRFFSHVQVHASGLSFPEILDGRNDEQGWFDDTLWLKFSVPNNLLVHYTTDGNPVSELSPVYQDDLKFSESVTLRYRAYSRTGEPVGHEILNYYEFYPLKIRLESERLIDEDERWERVDSWNYPFYDSLQIHISANRPGVIRFAKGAEILTSNSPEYDEPISIHNDAVVKAGLFKNDSLVGKTWSQNFKKIR